MATMKTSSLLAFLFVANLLFSVIATGCTKRKNPNPNPTPATSNGKCPRDALKLGVCAKLLNGSVGTVVGTPPDLPCCSLLGGLLDLEVALCLCTALKANILGINLNIPIALSVLLNTCGNKLPPAFQC